MNILEHSDHYIRKQDKDHFGHLIQVAMADGKIETSELELLHRFGSKLGLTAPEVDDLLETSKKSAYIPPDELSKRFGQLFDVIKMVYADGQIGNNEMRLATGLALKSGFTEQELPLLLALLINGIKNNEEEDDLFELFKKRRLIK